jgi:hypothetical protein
LLIALTPLLISAIAAAPASKNQSSTGTGTCHLNNRMFPVSQRIASNKNGQETVTGKTNILQKAESANTR